MSFVPFFVREQNPTFDYFLDHIDHIVEVAGVDIVGIGSDFDGGGTLLKDALAYGTIAEGLQARGYNDESVKKILGGNFFRVIKEAIG